MRQLAHECIQASAMDCGPASIASYLHAFGIEVSYERLRELCQTTVNGTSIDRLGAIANELGVPASQHILPLDLVPRVLDEGPAILILDNELGAPHFSVHWNTLLGRLQLMDPAIGRRWIRRSELTGLLYTQPFSLPGDDLRELALDGALAAALREQLSAITSARHAASMLSEVRRLPGWQPIASLDVSVRVVGDLVHAGLLSRGAEAERSFAAFFALAVEGPSATLPPELWSILPDPDEPGSVLFGSTYPVTVVLSALDFRGPVSLASASVGPSGERGVRARIERAPVSPWLEIARLLSTRWRALAGLLAVVAVVTAVAALLELLLLQSLLQWDYLFPSPLLRLVATAVALLFFLSLVALELPSRLLRRAIGRVVEMNVRMRVARRIARLPDAYFRSRLMSDMAERAHSVYLVRESAAIGSSAIELVADVLVSLLALTVISPRSGLIAAIGMLVMLGLLRVAAARLVDYESRVQSAEGALSVTYFDAVLGGVALRAHGASSALRHEQGRILGTWNHAVLTRLKAYLSVGVLVYVVPLIVQAVAVFDYVYARGANLPLLFVVYWTSHLAHRSSDWSELIRQGAQLRTRLLRILEPLAQPERELEEVSSRFERPVSIDFDGVSFIAGGHSVLERISVSISAGTAVAIVGASGAGKSSFLATILGFAEPSAGTIHVNGERLDAAAIASLHRHVVWIDPAIHLFNRTLRDNVLFGNDGTDQGCIDALRQVELLELVARAQAGLEYDVGECGRKLSGGEGQRVRVARGLMRPAPSLVILDEAFRGLDRPLRERLYELVRAKWPDATLLCVTHDIEAAAAFDRVLVFDHGQLVEDGAPSELLARPSSHYAALFRQFAENQERVWGSSVWRRVSFADGAISTPPLSSGSGSR